MLNFTNRRAFHRIPLSVLLLKIILFINSCSLQAQQVDGNWDFEMETPRGDSIIRIKDTDYPFPSDAKFVAATGNDSSGNGTQTQPYKTLLKAIQLSIAGGTIVLREGTYRMGDVIVNKKLIIQPFPHEKVWIRGSLEADEWQTTSDGLWTKQWPYHIPLHSETVNCSSGCYIGLRDSLHIANHRENVFINEKPLKQVLNRNEVIPGTFWVDKTDKSNVKYFIGSSPINKSVEITSFEKPLEIRSAGSGSVIRGLGFLHGAKTAFFAQFTQVTLENNSFAWGSEVGCFLLSSPNCILRGNSVRYNGQTGLRIMQSDNYVVTDNYISDNNVEDFAPWWGAGGFKVGNSKNGFVKNNLFERNLCTALWYDINCFNTFTQGNLSRFNKGWGTFYEAGSTGTVIGNLYHGNAVGIKVANTGNVNIFNNTIVNCLASIDIIDGNRTNNDSLQVAAGNDWNNRDIAIVNNIISTSPSYNTYSRTIQIMQNRSCVNTQNDPMVSRLDNNYYYREIPDSPKYLIQWRNTGCTGKNFALLADFQNEITKELDGKYFNRPSNPFFIIPANNDYNFNSFQLIPGSPAIGKGAELPANLRDSLSLPSGVKVSVGAIQTVHQTLPVKLISFFCVSKADRVTIKWTNAQEQNNEFYTIQKRINGAPDFIPIGTIAVKGGLLINNSYELDDMQPFAGLAYYRLAQKDKDGKITYFEVVSINRQKLATPGFTIYPKPTKGLLNITVYNTKNEATTIELYDLNGNTLLSKPVILTNSSQNINLNLHQFANGQYILKMKLSGVAISKLIQKI